MQVFFINMQKVFVDKYPKGVYNVFVKDEKT